MGNLNKEKEFQEQLPWTQEKYYETYNSILGYFKHNLVLKIHMVI